MNGFPPALLRPDLADFAGYSSARTSHAGPEASIWLNANESATPSLVDPGGRQRRYPDPQPAALIGALAAAYGVDPARVVAGRGSDEVIDLLVRALCRPGGDGVVVASPTFGMYAVSARLHGVPVTDVPQQDLGTSWRVDVGALVRRSREVGARLVFVASPGNPTGSVLTREDIDRLVTALADQALVVVDEAYQEFSSEAGAVELLARHPTLAVLRTLSKAHALAAVRVGVGLVHPDLAVVLRRVQAPYPLSGPVTDLAVDGLGEQALSGTRERVARVLTDRTRLADVLRSDPRVRTVYASEANFLLTRCARPDAVLAALRESGIVVRDMRHLPGLEDALRVTVGTDEEISAVATALTQANTTPTRTP